MVSAVLMLILAAAQAATGRTALGTVMDPHGRPIIDLGPDDVVIQERGQPREVLSVRPADYPIALVLDNGSGAGADFTMIREAASRFVGRVGHRPMAIALADPSRLIATFDDERAVVFDRLARTAASQSAGDLFGAILTAARTIQETGALFSAIVVISGTPASRVPTQLLTPIFASGATVHVVLERGRSAGLQPGPPSSEASGQSPAAATDSSEALRALADETRGQFTTIYSPESYQVAVDRLADRIAPELMVDFVEPAGSSNVAGDVQIGVRIPGARVIGRGVR